MRLYAVFRYVLDCKLCDEREIVVAEEQRQQEQHRALQKKVSIKREETEQQLAGYQKRAEVIEKLLDQLKKGTARYSIYAI